MLVSGHNYKTLLISTRIIYTKNIFTHTKKYNPCLTSKAESFREKTGELLSFSRKLIYSLYRQSKQFYRFHNEMPSFKYCLHAENLLKFVSVIVHVLPNQGFSRQEQRYVAMYPAICIYLT